MHVIIDFGSSRTAIAVTDSQWGWQPLGMPVRHVRNVSQPGWLGISNLIDGVVNICVGTDRSIPLIITFSSYCKIDNLVLPLCISGRPGVIQFPSGCTVVPPLVPHYISVKENLEMASEFLEALTKMVYALAPPGSDWVMGQTSRSIIDQQQLNLPVRLQMFNEAAAVIFAIVSVDGEDLLRNSENKFVVVADLGGGFLDICVAHKVVLGEQKGSANIVNYGGYPIGVDRIGLRFSEALINCADPLIKLVVTTVANHICDYCEKHMAQQTNRAGIVFLTGGGFKRIENVHRRIADQLIPLVREVNGIDVTVDRQTASYDSKYLTIAGLARMASVGRKNITSGDDISDKDPRYHGRKILEYQDIKIGAHVLTWYGLVLSEFRTSYTVSFF